MSRTIHKHGLGLADYQAVKVGVAPRFLAAGIRDGRPTMWVETDTGAHDTAPREVWYVSVVPTGGTVPVGAAYLGTCQSPVWGDVWHLYLHHERGKE